MVQTVSLIVERIFFLEVVELSHVKQILWRGENVGKMRRVGWYGMFVQ